MYVYIYTYCHIYRNALETLKMQGSCTKWGVVGSPGIRTCLSLTAAGRGFII